MRYVKIYLLNPSKAEWKRKGPRILRMVGKLNSRKIVFEYDLSLIYEQSERENGRIWNYNFELDPVTNSTPFLILDSRSGRQASMSFFS